MECREFVFSGHAIRRMFERAIKTEYVKDVIGSGEIIADYPDDLPYPSFLMLGMAGGRPIHVVVAIDEDKGRCYIVTAYIPESKLWGPDFRTRSES